MNPVSATNRCRIGSRATLAAAPPALRHSALATPALGSAPRSVDIGPDRGAQERATPSAWWLLCLALTCWASSLAHADNFLLTTSYENHWFTTNPPTGPYTNYFGPSLTNAPTALFCGHVFGNTNSALPKGGGFGLEWSSFGQPVEGVQSDVALGDLIVAPTGADTNQPPANFVAVQVGDNLTAYYQCTNPIGGAFWVPSTKQIIAAQPNNLTIDWRMTNGTITHQLLNVSAVPTKRAARLFWTESPYDAPIVSLSGLFPAIHYNSEVPAPVYQITMVTNNGYVTTTTNVISGVWLDDQKQLHAKGVSGLFVLEYYQEGSYKQQVQPDGIEIVQVLEPDLQLVTASLGERLMPVDTYWAELDGINGLLPNITHGLNDTAYLHSQTGPKDNWAFSIKRTFGEPWSLEIYWQHKGCMGVLWPYEVDWYSCDWPAYPQRYVIDDASPSNSAPVLFPSELSAQLMDDMEPALHASLSSSGRSLSTSEPGYCLLKYTTDDDVWFEVIRSVSHTNEVFFDLEPREWTIGTELTPGDPEAHALRLDGKSQYVQVSRGFLNQLTDWTLALWFNPATNNAVLYSEGQEMASSKMIMRLQLASGQLSVGTWNDRLSTNGSYSYVSTTNAVISSNQWHFLALAYSGGSDTNGTLRVYLDDDLWEMKGLPRINCSGTGQTMMGAYCHYGASAFFAGALDEVRLWNGALTSDQIRSNRYAAWSGTSDSLIANFPFNEGEGCVVHNLAGEGDGTAISSPTWCYGQVFPIGQFWAAYPGYIHVAEGDRYNVKRYGYPSEASQDTNSYVFAVNTGLLEVWWANRSRQTDMPAVYYPSRVVRYTNVWPTTPPQIVIASGLGSKGDSLFAADNALRFNGATNSYATVPNDPVLNVGSELTLEAWVRLDAAGSNGKIASWVLNSLGFCSGFTNGQFYPEVWNSSQKHYSLSAGTLSTGAWTHVAFTYKAGDSLVAYVNGQQVGSVAVANAPVGSAQTSLTLGRSSAGGSPLLGALGEVRVWNLVRTADQIQANRYVRLNGDEGGLVAYYPCEPEADSSVLVDAGLFGLDGVITNATWTAPGRLVSSAGAIVLGSPSIYYQNDSAQAGFNPNEEHALMTGGIAYALRNDLDTSESEPFVLVDYLDPNTARPMMKVYSVLATNELYSFQRNLVAGLPIEPIMPLSALTPCTNTFSYTQPPAWRDRKAGWWAMSAGDDGGTTNAVMHFYYPMQSGFWFPGLSASNQPAAGTELPWLPDPSDQFGTQGTPVSVIYTISWPDVPTLRLGQTLTKASGGLPGVWDQLSAQVLYQQSDRLGQGVSVDLFDPVLARGVDLDSSVINAMITSQLARRDSTSSLVRFPNLAPSIYARLYYDPSRGKAGQLVLQGQLEETLTGTGYLLLNLLEDFEKALTRDTAIGIDSPLKTKWDTAVNALPSTITNISPNEAYVNAALGARLSSGAGYVTLVFNNSTNRAQVPPALPVSLEIIKVDTNLYAGELEVIEPGDALAEQLSLRFSADFAGHVSDCDFRWRYQEPVGGLIPNSEFETQWFTYGGDPTPGTNEITIAGASPFTLSDHYFAVQYRPRNTKGPSGTNWSDWTYNLAQGWVKRVMNNINPFLQMLPDMTENTVDTRSTMMSQAGGPYVGDIALNTAAASEAGLIPTYETVFNRAMEFSLLAGLSDASMNETLLYAASRLHDLYMLLGNEAYADAQDPTIAFPQELSQDTKGATATSIFPFMNQVPNLLEEELALLRGRDDTFSPAVTNSPVYNRLIWNFTAGINGGEPAYAYNYNIGGNSTNTEGTITAVDAKRLYPQGHGDAWGHYLSALSHYYDLLSYTNFVWQTEPSATLMEGTTVTTDFLDEQKFAETAAARARTGLQIVKQTFRQRYTEGISGLCAGYHDSDTNRAWGIGDWACRAGQAAFYDWAVANSLMLPSLTNLTQIGGADAVPEGIQKIDRASTPELREITASYKEIQTEADSADGGLNPLGLARGVVPFDIDPAEIDAGKTHFEQVYDRALQATYNACVAFDQARGATLRLRDQYDSVHDLQDALAESEMDYHNRLIELYGYPYSNDIGPTGTYPQGYDGPDLVNWQILDLENLLVNAPTGQVMQVDLYNLSFLPGNDFSGHEYEDYIDLSSTASSSSNYLGTITNYMADNGLKVKPASWDGRRQAQGELQLALSDYVQAWYALDAKIADYNQSLAALQVEIDHRLADYERYPGEWEAHEKNEERKKETARVVTGLNLTKEMVDIAAELTCQSIFSFSGLLPETVEGFEGPFPIAEVHNDLSAVAQGTAVMSKWVTFASSHSMEIGAESREMQQELWDADLEELLQGNEYRDLLEWSTADTQVRLREQYTMQAELQAQVEALGQCYERVQKLVAEGNRLILERSQARARAAQRIQRARYADISFRIYRDDALRRYQQTFNLAARYTYLAAKAYDYETGLLQSDTAQTPGSQFLADVVRARLPGKFYTWLGQPMVGDSVGEPGLADVLARMKADWDVVKGRFGFNNPETETSRFSLRTELYRISPAASGDATWAQALENCKVANLYAVPEFMRCCRPYNSTTNIEPGLVIPFSTYVVAGKNYFGNDLAGGDNAYDASHAATKIRSAGVWFSGFNSTFTTNNSSGLANQPRVYLIPVGEDVMRSPTRNAVVRRHWKVVDQAIPLPFNIGGADIDNPDWQPITDSLAEPLAQLRRFASFRAYHDSGDFDSSETCTNGRLVGRSVWNTRWLLIIPGRTLLSDPDEGVERFVHGSLVNSTRDGNGIKDIRIFFQTYSISGD